MRAVRRSSSSRRRRQRTEVGSFSAEMSVYNAIYFDNPLASSARAPASMPAKPILPSWQAYS